MHFILIKRHITEHKGEWPCFSNYLCEGPVSKPHLQQPGLQEGEVHALGEANI